VASSKLASQSTERRPLIGGITGKAYDRKAADGNVIATSSVCTWWDASPVLGRTRVLGLIDAEPLSPWVHICFSIPFVVIILKKYMKIWVD
jgi:hypothetical protein